MRLAGFDYAEPQKPSTKMVASKLCIDQWAEPAAPHENGWSRGRPAIIGRLCHPSGWWVKPPVPHYAVNQI